MWSNKLELILRGKGLWAIVDDTETDREDASEAEKTKFRQRMDSATTTIMLTIEDNFLSSVITERDPGIIWSR